MPMVTKLSRMLTYLEGLPPMALWSFGLDRSCDKHIFSTTRSVATKLGRVVTYNEEFLLIILHNPSIVL